jgi:hypothetical protein
MAMVGLQLLMGFLLVAAQPQPAQPRPTRSVAGFAAYLQEDFPHRFSGYTAVSARAEGDLLVLTMDGRRGWRRRKSNEEVTRETMGGFCGPDGNFLATLGGGSLRVDTLEDGQNLERGTIMSECPAR